MVGQETEADTVTKADTVGVVLVDDHGVVREGLRLILEQTPDIKVLGEAGTGQDGVRLALRLANDPMANLAVVVTDLALPDFSGLEVAQRLKAAVPSLRVLILTMHADDEHIRGMLAAGADGYLLKQAAGAELAAAIHAVARGETALSPAVARRLVAQLRGGPPGPAVDELSAREREILVLLARGATSKGAARELGLSRKTVENHRARILSKLGVANTAQAIALAHQRGLIPPIPPE